MRSAVVAAAFVAGALAVPYQKRAMVVDTVEDVVWVTDVVTVTAGQPAVSAAAEPTTTERVPWWSWHSSAHDSPTYTPPPQTTTQAPAPVTTTQAPPPPETTTQAPPPPETTTQAPAPTTTAAATTAWSSEPATSVTAAAGSYQSIVLAHHNVHRQNHSAGAVTWAADLESSAQTVAESCVYAHNT